MTREEEEIAVAFNDYRDALKMQVMITWMLMIL